MSPPWQSSYGPTPGVLAYNLSFLGRIDSGSREEYDGLPVRVSVWRGRLRRAGWGMADQGFSSLTNFALGVLVARSVSPQAFGAFALVFTIYTLLLGFCRALATEPLLVRFTAAPDRWPSGVSSAAGMAALIGVFAGSGCLIVGSIFGGFIGYGLIGLGLTLPGLLVQDSWRYAFFAEGRADKAFVNDVVWAIVLAVAFPLLAILDQLSLLSLMLAWGIAASVGAVFGVFQSHVIPNPGRTRLWWRQQRDLTRRYIGEFAAINGAGRLADFGVGAVAGLSSLGSVRGATILLGPLNVLLMGARMVSLPEAVRILNSSRHKLRRLSALVSFVLAIGSITWGAIIALLPSRFGVALLGSTWPGARRLIVPIALGSAAQGILMGAGVGLRALLAVKRALRARVILSLLILPATIGGAAVGQAYGAAWGGAAAAMVGAILWWGHLNRAIEEYGASQAGLTPAVAMEVQPD